MAKTVSCLATTGWKTAKRVAVQQPRMLDSKIRCCLGTSDGRQQNRLLHRNRRCWTADSFPAATDFIVRESGPIHYYCPHMNPRILAISGPLEGTEFFIGEADLKIGRGA